MGANPRIDTRDVEGVTVIRFVERQLFDERTVREAADEVAAALPNDGRPIKLVLDFSEVAMISSSLLSKLILLLKRVDTSRGGLRLCELSDTVRSVFRSSNLDRLFKIERDVRAAIASLG